MTRLQTLLISAGLLAAVGCRTCEERSTLFPRLRGSNDEQYAKHLREQLPPAVATSTPCLPCSGVGMTYPSGTTLGMPTVVGGSGYAMPTGYSSPPVLNTPIYPSGTGTPYLPKRDDELPLPGEYSRPGAAETGRSTAPKPPSTLPSGK